MKDIKAQTRMTYHSHTPRMFGHVFELLQLLVVLSILNIQAHASILPEEHQPQYQQGIVIQIRHKPLWNGDGNQAQPSAITLPNGIQRRIHSTDILGDTLESYPQRRPKPPNVLSVVSTRSEKQTLLSVMRLPMNKAKTETNSENSSSLSSTSLSSNRVPVFGSVGNIGMYYAEVFLGNQEFHVQLDTGSSVLAVPLDLCASCRSRKYSHRYSSTQNHHNFIPCSDTEMCSCPVLSSAAQNIQASSNSKSRCCSTFNASHCYFSLLYADGAKAAGSLLQDTLRLGGSSPSSSVRSEEDYGNERTKESGSDGLASKVVFGGIVENSKDFDRDSVDGIFGMSPSTTSCRPSCFKTALQTLVDETKVKNLFTMCLNHEGGVLTMGAVDYSVFAEPPIYVPYTSKSVYEIPMGDAFIVGKKVLSLRQVNRVIVDSGTTLLVVPSHVFAKIKEVFEVEYCSALGLCRETDWFESATCYDIPNPKVIQNLPTIKFQLEIDESIQDSYDKNMPSHEEIAQSTDRYWHWMVRSRANLLKDLSASSGPDPSATSKGSRRFYHLSLEPSVYMLKSVVNEKHYYCLGIQSFDLQDEMILGNSLMLKYGIVYDREAKRIGFGRTKPNCGR